MRKGIVLTAAAMLGLAAVPAKAGIHTDALALCLVEKSSAADRTYMMQWIFVAMSAHPDVGQFAKVTNAQRDSYGKGMGALMSRLLTVDCRAQSIKAIRHDGDQATETAFGKLGEVAMNGLMEAAPVQAELNKLLSGIDLPALAQIMSEAAPAAKE